MNKKLYVLLIGFCLFLMSACGNNEAFDLGNALASLNDEEKALEMESYESTKVKLNMEEIVWNVDEGIVDGERYVLLDYTNDTPYTIASFEITFIEKSDITEEDNSAFYADIQKMFEMSDEEIEEIKEYPISMHASTERAVEAGKSVTNINCLYYTGYYYVKNMNHYNLVEPDIATIKYVDENKIYTVYYDYGSKKYSAESETEVAYQWSQTEIGGKIPKPDVKILESSLDTEDTFMFNAYGMTLEQFNDYVGKCKTFGYTIDPSSFEGFYSADNTEGCNIYLSYDKDDYAMRGTVKILNENNNTISKDGGAENKDVNEELVDGMRTEFKEAMDSYEAFYDEYCDVIKKYIENPTDTELLTNYTDMLAKADEMQKKFDMWEDDEMNNEELEYYLDVNNRIAKKLLDIKKSLDISE